MKKNILSIILSILILFSVSIQAFATSDTSPDSSLVTFRADMCDPKIAYYYSSVYVDIFCVDEGKQEKYTVILFEENDFSRKISLPNGNYVISSGGIENDLQSFVQTQEFTVGSKPNILVNFTVYKDMSDFPDIPEATTATVVSTTSASSGLQTPSSTTQNAVTTENTPQHNTSETTQNVSSTNQITETTTITPLQNPPSSFNWSSIIVTSIFAIGIIVFIVFLIRKYKN